MTDFEDGLSEFKPAAPAPALKERVMAAARRELHRTWVDRLWTGRTWAGLAAAILLSFALFLGSVRPPAELAKASRHRRPGEAARAEPHGPLPESWVLPLFRILASGGVR